MPTPARVVVVPGEPGPLQIHEVNLPDPGPHQVVVKQFASGVCHSQLHQMHRPRNGAAQVLGHESTGVVMKKGSAVTHIKEGDRVMVTWVRRDAATSTRAPESAAIELGNGVVAGKNLSNIDLTTSSGATDAMRIIDAAIGQVSKSRGALGSFQRNAVESNIRSLGVAKENLSATESSIRDADIADEMTSFTKLQILQQSGLSVLAQANAAPQAVLSLLRG